MKSISTFPGPSSGFVLLANWLEISKFTAHFHLYPPVMPTRTSFTDIPVPKKLKKEANSRNNFQFIFLSQLSLASVHFSLKDEFDKVFERDRDKNCFLFICTN